MLLDHPGSTYWQGWKSFVESELLAGGMIGPADLDLFLHTHDPAEAAEYLCAFYSCYHSLRYVGKRLVLRLRTTPSTQMIETLNLEFTDIMTGEIEAIEATDAERRDGDNPDLPRLALRFNNRSFGRLVQMIRRINDLAGTEGASAVPGLVHDVEPDADYV